MKCIMVEQLHNYIKFEYSNTDKFTNVINFNCENYRNYYQCLLPLIK
jgi:ssRNA-specific RNase YbeY (16S rRNA maturation enzyme)